MRTVKTKKIKSEIVLAGDVGGTKTRLGLFEVTRGRLHLLFEKSFLNKNYRGLENILVDFIKGEKGIIAACFGVAGRRRPPKPLSIAFLLTVFFKICIM